MSLENESVNTGVQATADTSQVSNPGDNNTGSGVESSTTAGSENTVKDDPNSHMVPRTRLNEKIEEKKSIEKEYQSYKEKMKSYEQIDEVVNSDPVFNKAMNKVIEDYNAGKLTAEQAQDKMEDLQADQPKTVETKTPQVAPEIVQINKTLYQNEFNSLATKDFTDAEDLRAIELATNQVLNRIAPTAALRYQPGVIDKAYKEAKTFLDSYTSRRMSGYVKDKASEVTPPTKAGVSASTEEKFITREDRIRALADGLKNT